MDPVTRLVPHMREYDRLGSVPEWKPYLMFVQASNFTSPIVNTDRLGLRVTHDKAGPFSIDDLDNGGHGILIGNSTAFGVGATSDATTIASCLSQTDYRWVSVTGRAYSGWQELTAYLAYRSLIPSVRQIVILSGLNDFYLYFLPSVFSDLFGPFFYAERYRKGMQALPQPGYFSWLFTRPKLPKKPDLVSLVRERWQHKEVLLKPICSAISAWGDIARGSGIPVTFVLQPIAPWIERTQTKAERELLEFYDNMGSTWHELTRLTLSEESYRWYAPELAGICSRSGIRFVDLNRQFPSGDHFIDRVHLTDEGQRETAARILNA